MTKRQAAIFFFAVTGVFTAVFVGMTIHSHTRFPDLTNADRITDEVLAGKDVWHHNNCVNCHTLMGEGAYFAPDLTRITQHRGEAYLTAFMHDPGRFYSEEVHGRVMPVHSRSLWHRRAPVPLRLLHPQPEEGRDLGRARWEAGVACQPWRGRDS